ncbi:MAG: RtcB family protein [Bacillota bacterium]
MAIKRLNNYTLLIDSDIKVYLNKVLEKTLDKEAVTQLQQAACLPSVFKICALPDVHAGFGLPIGGVMGTYADDGVISPGAVGVDINCGVRLIATRLNIDDLEDSGIRQGLLAELKRVIPAGEGKDGICRLERSEFQKVLERGSQAVINGGWGDAADLEATEDGGLMPDADPDSIPMDFREKGRRQLGSLGSGNHFVEIQAVDQIFRPELADRFGLKNGMLTVMIHSGSRGMGNLTANYFVNEVCARAMKHYGIETPNPKLVCVPFRSREGKAYWSAMSACANYAWANRQVMMKALEEMIGKFFGGKAGFRLIYDVAHNIAKLEEHQGKFLVVHRKGATRAFPAGDKRNPHLYKDCGQPAIIPGSMGTRSWIVVGSSRILETLCSVNHGSGRTMSRRKASGSNRRGRQIDEPAITHAEFFGATIGKGIMVASGTNADLRDEAPGAYKDSEQVMETVYGAGLAVPVAAFRPLVVLKG